MSTTTQLSIPEHVGHLEPKKVAGANPFKSAALALFERAKSIIKIETREQYEMAAQLLKVGANATQKVGEFYDPKVADARKPWDNLCAERKAILDSLKATKDYTMERMNEFEAEARRVAKAKQDELDRIQREEQQQIQQQKIEDERKFREAEAEILTLQNKPEEAAAVLAAPIAMPEPEFEPAPIVQANIPQVEGVTAKMTYKARLIGTTDPQRNASLKILCAAIGRGEVPVLAVEMNGAYANTLARTLKDLMAWPGVEVIQVPSKMVSKK